MSFGKSTSTTTPTLSDEQKQQISAQTQLLTGTVIPAYQGAVAGAGKVYENAAGGVNNAAQNLAGTANQAQQVLGSTGESAVKTGISGLENVFGKDNEQQQLQAALAPAQLQYQQNLANQQAQFGGAGNLGSSRSALAQAGLAGQTQAQQQAAAAQVENNIAQQRLAAGQSLTSAGQGGLGQAVGAAGQAVNAAMVPSDLYAKYASVIFGTPQGSYLPTAPYGSTSSTSGAGFNGTAGLTKALGG